jgi:N-acetyl-anhydromuramyl-L-alanine amidase AmpD
MNSLTIFIKFLLSLLSKPPNKKVVEDIPINESLAEPVMQPNNSNPVISNPVEVSIQKEEIKIIKDYLPPNQYVQDSKFIPNQIVLHHTAGGSINSSITYWKSSRDRVGVHFCIDRNGDIYQCIPLERAWAYHLYVASPGNKIERRFKVNGSMYDRQAIGIELANYGYADVYNGRFLNCYGQVMSPEKVTKLDTPFRGKSYWEKYTDAQINSLEKLLIYLLEQFPKIGVGINKDFSDIFEINREALLFVPGIYGHISYRTDKSDIYKDKDLLEMLNNLHLKV